MVRLVAKAGGKVTTEVELAESRYAIGRSSSACQVHITERTVSRVQAEPVVGREKVTIRDLGSENGVKVGWSTDTALPCPLGDDDVVWLSQAVCLQLTGTARKDAGRM
jgi:hypothetical protein